MQSWLAPKLLYFFIFYCTANHIYFFEFKNKTVSSKTKSHRQSHVGDIGMLSSGPEFQI